MDTSSVMLRKWVRGPYSRTEQEARDACVRMAGCNGKQNVVLVFCWRTGEVGQAPHTKGRKDPEIPNGMEPSPVCHKWHAWSIQKRLHALADLNPEGFLWLHPGWKPLESTVFLSLSTYCVQSSNQGDGDTRPTTVLEPPFWDPNATWLWAVPGHCLRPELRLSLLHVLQ